MTEHEIRSSLTTKKFGNRLYLLETVDSTNNYAKTLTLGEFDEGTVVIAEHQTAGRGRHDHVWFAESGKNLTFSVLLKPRIAPRLTGIISIYAGLAVVQAVEELYSLQLECKWPNDILLNRKKLCGILSEGVFQGERLNGVVIGIGMNVNQVAFPPSLEHTATSLARHLGRGLDRIHILVKILEKLEELYNVLQRGDAPSILAEWRRRSGMFGRELMIVQNGQCLKGIAHSLADDGALVITIDGKERKVFAGEVTVLWGNQP
jgi:BirA family transcriptional regulator, biotin operon repressor / biotin---[acetyl-CoA-carboxylase] ligase